jgi:predicted Fe-Mo cluster-binding NifX family protein
MRIRVAVGSNDGKYINQHFGHAQKFLIFDINEKENYEYVETRNNIPSCNEGDHTSGSLESTINILKDVDIVLVSQIGPGASQYLLNNRIQPVIMPGFIDEKLDKISKNLIDKKQE